MHGPAEHEKQLLTTKGPIMLLYDDIFEWEGWGGKLRLGSGKCRLRIYDLRNDQVKGLTLLRPFVVLVTDIPDGSMSVKSCAGHIATRVTARFKIDPHRMLYIEYYPEKRYGENDSQAIPETFEAVEFNWHKDMAMHPKWRELKPPLLGTLKKLVEEHPLV